MSTWNGFLEGRIADEFRAFLQGNDREPQKAGVNAAEATAAAECEALGPTAPKTCSCGVQVCRETERSNGEQCKTSAKDCTLESCKKSSAARGEEFVPDLHGWSAPPEPPKVH